MRTVSNAGSRSTWRLTASTTFLMPRMLVCTLSHVVGPHEPQTRLGARVMRERRRARPRGRSVRPTKCRLPSQPAQAQGKRRHLSPDPSRYYTPDVARADRDYSIEDHGAERVLT